MDLYHLSDGGKESQWTSEDVELVNMGEPVKMRELQGRWGSPVKDGGASEDGPVEDKAGVGLSSAACLRGSWPPEFHYTEPVYLRCTSSS